MAKTATATFDNVGNGEPVTAPVSCRRITLRQDASVASPVSYVVHAPSSTDPGFHKYPAESTVFEALPGSFIQAGDIVGYIDTTSGTATFELICE